MLVSLQKNIRTVVISVALSLVASGFGIPTEAATVTASISGQVVDSNGDPVLTVVTLDELQSDSTFKVLGQVNTLSDGSFTFLNVSTDGKYQVSTKPSPAPNLTTAGRKANMHSQIFTVDEFGTLYDEFQSPIDLSLVQVPVVKIPVTVVASDASPVVGAVAVLTTQECSIASASSPTPRATATANTSGALSFYAPETGKYCLEIKDPTGFNTSISDSFTVTIPSDGSDAISEAIGDYTLDPAGTVEVKVVSFATGKVIAGAVVTGSYGDPEALETVSAISNSSGIAILKGLPDQTTISINVAGPLGSSYVDNTTSAVVIAGEKVLCDPPANGDSEGIVPLETGYPISGTVRDSAGVAIKDVTVDVQFVDDTGEEIPVAKLVTNAQGFYTTNGLAAGTYNLHFSDISSSASQFREDVDITGLVMSDKALTNQNVVLRDCGSLSGTVIDDNGDLLLSAKVTLRDVYGVTVGSVQDVDAETAEFLFTKILPGKYSLKIVASGFRDKFINNIDVIAQETTSISASDAQLASGSGISGRVVDTNALPIINAQVAVFSATGNGFLALSSTTTDTEGAYSFTNLPAGTYRIKFMSSGGTLPSFDDFWLNDSESNAASFATAADITTEIGVVATDINPVPVTPWASVTGTLTNGFDDNQEPVVLEGATVQLLSLNHDVIDSTLTDSSGAYTLYAPTGDYRVIIDAAGFSNAYLTLDSEGNGATTLVSGDALIVHFNDGQAYFTGSEPSASQTLPAVDVANDGGTLNVTIVSGSNPVLEGIVTVYDSSGNQIAWSDTTDENDAFVIKGLAQGMKSGTYRVSYELDGQYSKIFYGQTTSLNSAGTKTIVVSAGKTVAIQITAVPLPSLDLELKSSTSTSYSKPVTVEVYESNENVWEINSTLSVEGSINSVSKLLSVRLSAGGQYRVRIVPDESRIASVWLGTKPNAFSVEQATTISIPATGTVPKQTVLLNTPAIDVNAIVSNDFLIDSVPTDIRQALVTLTGNVSGSEVVLRSNQIDILGAGETVVTLFDRIPTAYFPITISATSVDSIAESVTLTQADIVDANIDHPDYVEAQLSFSATVEIATLAGTLVDSEGLGISDTAINLVTDDGIFALSTTTDADGMFAFEDLPLGVHLTIKIEDTSVYLTTSDNEGRLDFIAQSGEVLELNLEQHVAAMYSGTVFDPDLNPLAGAQVNIWKVTDDGFDATADPDYVVYSDETGSWIFDGQSFGADVGDYVFQVDGQNSDSLPAFYAPGDSGCETPDLSCTSVSAEDALPISTTKETRSVEAINLVLQSPDTVGPTGVKWIKQPATFSTAVPTWSWSGNDDIDGANIESQYVISTTSSTAKATGAWSTLAVNNSTSLKVTKPVAGTTYCLSIRMVDKSNNASSFLTPSCATVPLDDTKFMPTKKKDWVKVKAKDAYLGAVSGAVKTSKTATVTFKGYTGGTICVLYAKNPSMGSFVISQGKTKKGKIVSTAGAHKAAQSVCVASSVKATDTISVAVVKLGKGLQLDGFAVLPKAPARPTGY